MMHLIQILVPLAPTTSGHLTALKRRLTDQFGGVTAYSRAPAQGLWKDEGDIERDDVIIIEVMVQTLDRSWWAALRSELEQKLNEKEIVIRSSEFTRL